MSIEITQIQPQKRNKNRFNLMSEEGFVTSLSYETILKYGIREGKEIAEELLEQAKQDDTVKYAKEQAMQYVAYAPRSQQQVRNRLAQKGIDKRSIAQALDTMEKYGYIDDGAYVKEFTRSYSKRLGEQAIRQKLLQNGIDNATIAENLQLTEEEQLQTARRLAEKSLPRLAKLEPQKAKQRLYGALQRRGFSGEIIRRVMADLELNILQQE